MMSERYSSLAAGSAGRMAAEETGAGTGEKSGNLTFTPTRVEFTCPEEFELDGLKVFDAKDEPVMPYADEAKDKPAEGVYMLMPGEYSYRIAAPGEEAEHAEKTAFTVEPGREKMTITLQAETNSETKEFTEVVSLPPEQEPAQPQQSAGPGVWGIAVGALLIGAVLGGVLMRLLGGRKRRGAPGGRLRIQAKAVQGVGARSDQQDALFMSDGRLYDKQGILMCVADGMGGLSDGAKMSQAVVSAVERGFAIEEKDDPERLIFDLTKQAAEEANRAISPNYGVGGSTMVMGYLRSGEFTFVSVGDSRISLYRNGTLWHLNRRHVFEEDLKLSALNGAGSYDAAVTDKKKGALTSFLGMGKLRYADLPDARIPLQRGDRIVLMSDGVFNTLSDKELAAILGGKVGTITGEIAEQIKQKANRYQDNFTAIVVAVE